MSAWPSFGLAMGQFDPPILQRVQRIRQHQQQALESAISLGAMALTDHAAYQQFEAMQALIDGFSPSQPVPATLAETWFGVVSDWIDQLLAVQLASVAALRRGLAEPIVPNMFARDPSPSGDERTDPLRSLVGASFGLYELISEQSQHLAEVRTALQAARLELASRKRIEQAKGLLMQFQGLSEAEAFGAMPVGVFLCPLPARDDNHGATHFSNR
ncbi:ANTAR domain-containing protein [Litorivicinus lipolyticus]|uniref:ANTAR domain-containing protein n=1 Tax=Litorivicinus lipolyticus TaxID=418701 RepID=UPI003B59EDC6